MILPVLCVLHKVLVEVLPNIATDLTLDGPTESKELLKGTLLIIHKGLRDVPTELQLWTITEVLLLGRLDFEAANNFAVRFLNFPAKPATGWSLNPLPSTAEVDFAKESPPVALQVIITILLSTRPLFLNIIPIPGPTLILRDPTFMKEIIRAPVESSQRPHRRPPKRHPTHSPNYYLFTKDNTSNTE